MALDAVKVRRKSMARIFDEAMGSYGKKDLAGGDSHRDWNHGAAGNQHLVERKRHLADLLS